ncbi:hypothetical protein PsAD2_01900 [Pseudovibrio axinellae]|uniref:Uncharacterized protein n=1 Tax=Pseudovibrio axinellae TaxID=989403 RepID=A0A165Z954_9HYPH|nr:hypothetical protein [Pseudovibrio axinellae]KZL19621.1 hypothetical protein PsAD2_01900 [Pseudovibrio axinellae]SEQ34517.1 hypothetical protein SAMN05421798_102461 [Pseudovibrio axinellae]
MAILMKFKGIAQVYKDKSKIEGALKKAKVDESNSTAFMKELVSKRSRAEDKFLEEVNNDSKLKKFEAKFTHSDGGYGKELKAAAERVVIQLVYDSGKVSLKIGRDVVVAS